MSHVQQLANGRYKARWNDPDTGKDRAKTFDTKREAKEHLVTVSMAIRTGDYVDPSRSKVTVGDYAQAWLSSQRLSSSRALIADNAVRIHIVPSIGTVFLAKLDQRRIQAFVDEMRVTMKASSVRNVLEILTRILKDAKNERLISRTPIPARGEGTPIRIMTDGHVDRRALSPEEVSALVRAASEELKPLLLLLSTTGLRIGEALGLEVGSLDLARSTVLVSRQRRQDGLITATKTGRKRSVPLTPAVIEALNPLIVDRPAAADLWVTPIGESLSYRGFRYMWDRAVRESGINWRPRPHDLRHFYASHLIANGVDIVRVSRFLGHATVTKTVNVYAHVMQDRHDDVTAILERVVPPSEAVA